MNFEEMQARVHQTAIDKGWWSDGRTGAECIALMHSELSEALEAMRKSTPEFSKKIPEYTEEEEELADLVIRLMDYSERHGLNIAGAIEAKADYNNTRAFKHGKKF